MTLFIWNVTRWFTREWWSYLFSGLSEITQARVEFEFGPWYVYRELPWRRLFGWESVFERVVCRAKGHPKGEVFFTVYGDEPDHHCRTCGEMLG